MKKKLYLLLIPILIGCNPRFDGSGPGPIEIVVKVDMLKFISPQIQKPNDDRGHGQSSYSISSEGRLLMQAFFSGLEEQLQYQNKSLRLRLQPVFTDQVQMARENLKLCPMQKPWMAGATWRKASPLPDGNWRPGGEAVYADCVSASEPIGDLHEGRNAAAPELSSSVCDQAGVLCFDLSNWYQTYVQEARANFGWILINAGDSAIEVYGDGNLAKGPRLHLMQN